MDEIWFEWSPHLRPCKGVAFISATYWLHEQDSIRLNLPTDDAHPFSISDIGRLLQTDIPWFRPVNESSIEQLINERFEKWITVFGLRRIHLCNRPNRLTAMLGQRSDLLDVLALLSRVHSGYLRVEGEFNWHYILNPYHPETTSSGKYLRSSHWTVTVLKGLTP